MVIFVSENELNHWLLRISDLSVHLCVVYYVSITDCHVRSYGLCGIVTYVVIFVV